MHLLVVLIIAMLVFGPKKLPELGKSLGHGIRGFKDSLEGKVEPTTRTQAPATKGIDVERLITPSETDKPLPPAGHVVDPAEPAGAETPRSR